MKAHHPIQSRTAITLTEWAGCAPGSEVRASSSMRVRGPVPSGRHRGAWPAALLSVLAVLVPAARSLAEPVPAERRGQAFWLELAKECRVPAGETASALVGEAVTLLGSPDSVWRDDVGYGVVYSCVSRARALSAGERRVLVERLTANLRKGIGSSDDDGVLLRSFSALDLSILAALELDDPVLDAAGYRSLLDAALAYLQDERDLRGLEPRVGWIHATAHTADLLKFLARDPRFTAADQKRLLEAAWSKMTTDGTPVFTRREDERLAAALATAVRRADFDVALLDGWLARFPELEQQVWAKAPPDPRLLDRAQNARQLLRSLYVALSLPAPAQPGTPSPPPTAAETAAREKLLATIQALRG